MKGPPYLPVDLYSSLHNDLISQLSSLIAPNVLFVPVWGGGGGKVN